jgi:hypothetical protein
MLKTFFLLACAYGTEGWEYSQEMWAYHRLKQRPEVIFDLEGGHIVGARMIHPATKLTDEDMELVAKLMWCRLVGGGGEVTPHGLLRLLPLRRLKDLRAFGSQHTDESIRMFYFNRPDVDLTRGPAQTVDKD